MTPEQRLEGLPPEKRLEGLSTEEIETILRKRREIEAEQQKHDNN